MYFGQCSMHVILDAVATCSLDTVGYKDLDTVYI